MSEQPGLVSSHAAYAKGAATETIGNLTGSEEWKQSGKQEQESAKKDMHAASRAQSATQGGASDAGIAGQIETKVGSLAGCPPMQEEEAAKKS